MPDTIGKEPRRPIHAIFDTAPKMLIDESAIEPGLHVIPEPFDVETNLLGISIQILWGQRILVFK